MVVPALNLLDLTKLQTSAAWWDGVSFWLVFKCYVACNVTLLLAVFSLNLYPRMMPTRDLKNYFLSTIFLIWPLLVLLFAIWCSSDPVHPSLCRSPCVVEISYCHSIYSAVTACLFFILWLFFTWWPRISLSWFDIVIACFLTICSSNPLFILKFHFLAPYVPVTWLLCSSELQLSCTSVCILEIFWLLMNLIFCFVTILSTDIQVLFFFFSFFQQPIFCCLDIFPFLPSVTGTQMGHNIGFSSPFTRNQSRLCDLCRWWANHHVVFCQIPDSSCLFAWWYSNTPFLVCIVKASFIHHRGEGICQKGLLWSQKHSTASEIMGKEIEVRAKRASAGVRLQCWL